MNREDIIRMAREAYYKYMDWANRDDPWRREHGSKHYEDIAIERAAIAAAASEREACAKVAGWLWQQFQDTKEAHERNSPEPFRPERFGFDQSTVQQSKRMMDAIRARGEMK